MDALTKPVNPGRPGDLKVETSKTEERLLVSGQWS
jgi:hypothetical protein